MAYYDRNVLKILVVKAIKESFFTATGRKLGLNEGDKVFKDLFGMKGMVSQCVKTREPIIPDKIIDLIGEENTAGLFARQSGINILKNLIALYDEMDFMSGKIKQLRKKAARSAKKKRELKEMEKEYNILKDLYNKSLKKCRKEYDIPKDVNGIKTRYMALYELTKKPKEYDDDYYAYYDGEYSDIYEEDDSPLYDNDVDLYEEYLRNPQRRVIPQNHSRVRANSYYQDPYEMQIPEVAPTRKSGNRPWRESFVSVDKDGYIIEEEEPELYDMYQPQVPMRRMYPSHAMVSPQQDPGDDRIQNLERKMVELMTMMSATLGKNKPGSGNIRTQEVFDPMDDFEEDEEDELEEGAIAINDASALIRKALFNEPLPNFEEEEEDISNGARMIHRREEDDEEDYEPMPSSLSAPPEMEEGEDELEEYLGELEDGIDVLNGKYDSLHGSMEEIKGLMMALIQQKIQEDSPNVRSKFDEPIYMESPEDEDDDEEDEDEFEREAFAKIREERRQRKEEAKKPTNQKPKVDIVNGKAVLNLPDDFKKKSSFEEPIQ